VKPFSSDIIECIAQWGKKCADCNGDIKCLEACSRDLRLCLDAAFPDSRDIEFESDKINYIMSSVFFLANRLSKATVGMAEFDKIVNRTKETRQASVEKMKNTEMKELLDEIIAKYF
jgi:hypothetical protein